MSWLLPKVQTPTPQKAPPAPERTDAEVEQAAVEQRRRFYQESSGRRSTLGGGLGGAMGGQYSSSKLLGLAA